MSSSDIGIISQTTAPTSPIYLHLDLEPKRLVGQCTFDNLFAALSSGQSACKPLQRTINPVDLQPKSILGLPVFESPVSEIVSHTVLSNTLLDAISNGTFWKVSDTQLLHLIRDEFATELNDLKHAYSIRQPSWSEMPGSPSTILYPDEHVHDEINRSLVGVLALRWINDNDYEKFTKGQPQAVRLERESFDWIREVFAKQDILNSTSYKVFALITSMVTNDLGKSASFIKTCSDATGTKIGHENHDLILHRAAEKGMVPALERLGSEYRNDIKQGIKLGGQFNVGQLAQAENVPASLAPLLEFVKHENAWNMRWMEQLLDLSGAAGHEDHTCARKLIEPILRSYRSVYDIVLGIIRGDLSARDGYDRNLSTRYQLIVKSGWQPQEPLSVTRPADRALMRILCMGNVADARTADLYYETFYSNFVGSPAREQLVEHLNRDGSTAQPAIQPTYAPSMIGLALANSLRTTGNEAPAEDSSETFRTKSKALAAIFRYLARVLSTPPTPAVLSEGDVTVIERDCRSAIQSTIESKDFTTSPDILDQAALPEDAVANRVGQII